jgi:hypothetical protein
MHNDTIAKSVGMSDLVAKSDLDYNQESQVISLPDESFLSDL